MNTGHAGIVVGITLMASTASAAPYSPQAGFHPRSGTITAAAELEQGAAYWNVIAGRTLFRVATNPQVTWHEATAEVLRLHPECARACAAPVSAEGRFTLTEPYVRVEVYSPGPMEPGTQAHELGHALGFDHSRRGVMGGHPRRSVDRKLLARAGY